MLVEWLVVGSWPFWVLTLAIVAAIVASVENEKGIWATVSFVGYLAAMHLAGGVNLLNFARENVELLIGGALGYLILGAVWGVAKWYFFTKKKASTIEEDYKRARRDFLVTGIQVPVNEPAPTTPARAPVFGSLVEGLANSIRPGSSAPNTGPTRLVNVPDATEETPVPAELRQAWQEHINRGHYTNERLSLKIVPPRPNDHKATILTWMTFWPASLTWTVLNDPVRAAFRHIYANMSKTLQNISNRAFSDISTMHLRDTKADTPPPPSSAAGDVLGPVPPGSSSPTEVKQL